MIPESEIKKTAFLPVKRAYDVDTIVTIEEVQDSIVLKDSDFEFNSICKVPVDNVRLFDKTPD